MNRFRKLFSLLFWFYSGYFGSQKQGDLPKFRFMRFALRFLSFYFIIYHIWYSYHLYWEIPLYHLTTSICNQLLSLPLEPPNLNHNGILYIRLLNLIYYPKLNLITANIFITISLILSTSNIKIVDRIRMLLLSLFVLLVSQIMLAIHDIYCWIIQSYGDWTEKRLNAYQIIDIHKIDTDLFFNFLY